MASPLAITLRAESAVVVSASEASVNATPWRTCARLTLRVTAFTAGGLTLYVDTSSTGSDNWTAIARRAINATGDYPFTVVGLKGYVRARLVVADGSSGIVAGVSGEAHQLYCSPDDLQRFGLPEETIESLERSAEDKADACLAATDEAEGYLATRYTMPLVAWGEALRLHTSKLAVVSFLDKAGWQPSGPDDVIMAAYDRAIAWLKGVSKGTISPPGIVDSSAPTAGSSVSGGARVRSSTLRGW